WQQRVARLMRRHAVHARKRPAVTLHLVGAEQLRAKRRLLDDRAAQQAVRAQAGSELGQMPEHGRATWRQWRGSLRWCSRATRRRGTTRERGYARGRSASVR